MKLFGIVLILAGVALACDIPTKHYKTMHCSPIGVKGTSCPVRYDCPSISQHDNSKCYFNGQTFGLAETVPNEMVKPFCSAQCYCRSGKPFAQFRCTHVDCPEVLRSFDYDNCIRTYKPNSCCSAGQVCGKDRSRLAKCTMNGDDYLAGQRMISQSDKCLTCICHEGFNEANIANDANCYETICGFELFYAKHVYNGGIPVYFKDRCCPFEWRMPKDTDQLAKRAAADEKTTDDPTLQCKYGKITMNVGDSLVPDVTKQYTYNCSCLIPPLAQCVMTQNSSA